MSMKSMQNLLDEYGESHQNQTNKLIHWICVPLIYFSLVCFIIQARLSTGISFTTAVFTLALLFYVSKSFSIAIGMGAFTVICMMVAFVIKKVLPFPIWQPALIIFVLAWVGQFIGHKIEGKKPSFLKDLQFLLVGPAWLLAFIYKKLGIKV